MRVGDAFQAIVGRRPIAIWATVKLCRISEGEAFVFRRGERRHQTPTRVRKAAPTERAELNGVEQYGMAAGGVLTRAEL